MAVIWDIRAPSILDLGFKVWDEIDIRIRGWRRAPIAIYRDSRQL